MVAPQKLHLSSSSSSSALAGNNNNKSFSYLVLAVKILLVLIIILLLPKFVFARTTTAAKKRQPRILQFRRYWQYERLKCEQQPLQAITTNTNNSNIGSSLSCANLIPEESLNCVYQCLSPTCYDKVYNHHHQHARASSMSLLLLEDGEIDIPHAMDFESCLQEEFRQIKQQRQRQRRQQRNVAASSSSSSNNNNIQTTT